MSSLFMSKRKKGEEESKLEEDFDERTFEDLQIEITDALNKLTDSESEWVCRNKNRNVEYVLKCSFTPSKYAALTYHHDPSSDEMIPGKLKITELEIQFELIRKQREPRPYAMLVDGLYPEGFVLLSSYTTRLSKEQGIFQTKGNLITNVLNLPSNESGAHFYKSFERCNFAKIVLNAAILALAKAKVLHMIIASAIYTKKILEADSGQAQYQNFIGYADEKRFIYTLAPEDYAISTQEMQNGRKTRGSEADFKVWENIALIAKHKFHKAISEDKFKVEAPAPPPYFLSL
jgi:hypothetical protein